MNEIAAFLGASLVLAIPGVLAVAVAAPRLRVGEHWSIGASTGLAAAAVAAVAIGHSSLRFFAPFWALCFAATALAWWLRRGGGPRSAAPRGRHAIGAWLGAVLLLVAVTRFWVASLHVLPPGGDPAFHLLLARKIALAQGMIFDWKPFQPVSLNYPVGSHFLVVLLSELGHLPLHGAFRLLCPLLGVLQTALVFHFTARATRHDEIALYAALVFGLWADYGSIGYYGWGGLPNQLGMCFLLALLTLLLEPRPSIGERAVMSVLLAGIAVCHHHVMVVSAFILATLAVFEWLRRPDEARHLAIFEAAGGAVVLAGIYLVPYAWKVTTLGSTYVFRFEEMFFDPRAIARSLGWAFAACTSIGLALSLADRRGRFDPVLRGAVVVLAVLFVLCEYVYRWLALRLLGHDYVAFTPSRFLTDLACFFAAYAGFALLRLRELIGRRTPVVLAALAVSLTLAPRWRELAAPTLPDGYLEAGEWIRTHTSADTIVMNTEPWTSYVTWRRNPAAPLPVSEPLAQTVAVGQEAQEILAGVRPPSSPAMKLVGIVPESRVAPGMRVLWRHPAGLVVVQVFPKASGP